MTIEQLRDLVRDVPDFPRPGIVFKDISPLLAHPTGFAAAVEALAARVSQHESDSLLAVESRGFIFAAPVAAQLGLPLHLVRKAGKLPHRTVGIEYELEYGSDRLEVHADVIDPARRYAIVDDVIATGGTAAATSQLLRDNGGVLACYAFVIELGFLNGRDRLGEYPVESLIRFE
ncbi:MAG: adenine phosphoribosyltransferase [Gammaproteobacteria bacterium]|nr:adenine phosphoribosyltransferase [Gammaproteobacteria bacterium]NND60589.1 adenine phosphoribosyltransferase [Gammaproteobacteria bacterium]